NPQRDVGARHIHGLEMRDLAHAPSFDEICPDLVAILKDRVLVAHNSSFDIGFLEAEFKRAGVNPPELPHVCTMRLAAGEGYGRRLGEVCASLGNRYTGAHIALDDARAAAEVLARWYQSHPGRPNVNLASCGCSCGPMPGEWP